MRNTSLQNKSLKQTRKANHKSTFKSSANHHNPAKRTRNRVPPPQRERILQKHVAGQTISEISREEKRNRETVTKIVRGPEMQKLVREMRERWLGLAPDAIGAVQHALTEQKDGRLGYQLLSSIGVIPSPEEMQLLTGSWVETQSDEDERVKKVLADLVKGIVDRAHVYGLPMPEIEADLKKVGGRINYDTGKIEPIEKKTAT